jgi:DNA-binding transcriptional ArsR family regulator
MALEDNSRGEDTSRIEDVRRISDSRVLAAMAHPLRRRMVSILHVEGPMTVSMLAAATDSAVGNISHHLRTLAVAGLVVEVPELARDKREHWWQRASRAIRWSPEDFAGDPAGETVAIAVDSINRDYQAAILAQWTNADADVRASWPHGPFSTDSWMRLTDAELHELGEELIALTSKWTERTLPDDGQERRTVFVFARGVPGRP